MSVVNFPGNDRDYTLLEINPDTMLQANLGKLKTLFMVGLDHGGDLVVGASISNLDACIALLERAKQDILNRYESD